LASTCNLRCSLMAVGSRDWALAQNIQTLKNPRPARAKAACSFA
jgi:hypothetical protein